MLCRSAVVTLVIAVLLAPISLGQNRRHSVEKAGPVVKIDSGLVMGMPLRLDSNEAIFKGIPYAAPPVGDLRWKPPQPVKSWQGVRPATEFGPACPQPDLLSLFLKGIASTVGGDVSAIPPLGKTDEDCLYLNVMTGNLGGKTRQPVMVWIHGGSGFLGRGSQLIEHSTAEGANIVSKAVVVVTINYRLGVFGFLAHPALSKESPRHVSGNYGLLE